LPWKNWFVDYGLILLPADVDPEDGLVLPYSTGTLALNESKIKCNKYYTLQESITYKQ